MLVTGLITAFALRTSEYGDALTRAGQEEGQRTMATIPVCPNLRLVQAAAEQPPVAVSRDAAGTIRLNGDAVLRGLALASGMTLPPKRPVQPACLAVVRSA